MMSSHDVGDDDGGKLKEGGVDDCTDGKPMVCHWLMENLNCQQLQQL